jgi:hypothetical protein
LVSARWTASSVTWFYCYDALTQHRPTAMEPGDHGVKLWNCEPKEIISPLSCLCHVFWHGDEKLTNKIHITFFFFRRFQKRFPLIRASCPPGLWTQGSSHSESLLRVPLAYGKVSTKNKGL